MPGTDRGRPPVVRHPSAERADQGAVLRHRRGDGRPAVGLYRLPDLRAVGVLRRGRLCGRAGLHAFRLLARSGGAGCAGGGAGLGGAGAGDGLAVLLPGSLAVLRHGDIAGAAYRADPGGAVRRHLYRLVLGADRLRQLRPVAAGLVRGGGGRAVGGGAAGLDGDAQRCRPHPGAARQRIALQLPGAGHGALAYRAAGRVRRGGGAGGLRLRRLQRRGGAGADRLRVRHRADHLGGAGRARHDLGAGAGRDPDQPGGLVPERLHALRVAVAAGRDLHRGHPAAAARGCCRCCWGRNGARPPRPRRR